jgi:hypothetical protein
MVVIWTNIVGARRRESYGPLILGQPGSMVGTHIEDKATRDLTDRGWAGENHHGVSRRCVAPSEIHRGERWSA